MHSVWIKHANVDFVGVGVSFLVICKDCIQVIDLGVEIRIIQLTLTHNV